MKRCPECRRDYYDDSLLYCLDDGSALLEGPGSLDQRTLVVPQDSGSIDWSLSSAADFPTQVLNTRTASGPAPENSIAILPFVNIGNDPDIEYFSDGLAEELLNVLSKIRGLRVAARTSSFSFKGKSTTVSEIGQALHVVSVVEGSIRMSGGRMRIAVQLVNVADGFQLWSDTYDRKIDDIFAVQDDIAQSVVGELRSRLLGEETPDDLTKQVIIEVAQASKGRSDVPEAQRQMLLGRYLLDRTTPDDTAKAVAHFNEAVELDPNFALCWAELGRAYSVQAGKAWGAGRPRLSAVAESHRASTCTRARFGRSTRTARTNSRGLRLGRRRCTRRLLARTGACSGKFGGNGWREHTRVQTRKV
jgi:TolB-like protein